MTCAGRRAFIVVGATAVASLTVGCSETASTASPSTVEATTARVTVPTFTSTTFTSTFTSTTAFTPTIPETIAATASPTIASAPTDFLGEEVIGTSVEGRPIVASHRGTRGGVAILVVGVIHGDESAGLAVLDALAVMPVPAGFDLWLMPAFNPDGLAKHERGNGNGVDLNRNFPHDWTQIGSPGAGQYSGTAPASEPETQAFIAFAQRVKPTLTLWYHQDLFRVSPSSGRDAPLRQRYVELTGLGYESITGGTYTGVAATWVRLTVPGAMSFIVELGSSVSAVEATVHATAVLAVAQLAPTV